MVLGEELGKKVLDVRDRDEVLEPARGIIYDRNHTELVGNYPVKIVYANQDIFTVNVRAGEGGDNQEKERELRDQVIKNFSHTGTERG